MISRRTALALSRLYEIKFSSYEHFEEELVYSIESEDLYDFLFERNYIAYFCNIFYELDNDPRVIQETIMKLHTGETIAKATPKWTWEERKKLGQEYLFKLTQDLLIYYSENPPLSKRKNDEKKELEKLIGCLELDGYVFKDKQLLIPEKDILEIQEEIGVIQSLDSQLSLDNREVTFHHLKLSEEHYLNGKWDDSISNSRKFLESVLREIASQHHITVNHIAIPKVTYETPSSVRDYLNNAHLLENKEKEALAKVYGLLSNTGSHPYMAEKDQARLLRQLSLTFSQFVLLRYQGFKSNKV